MIELVGFLTATVVSVILLMVKAFAVGIGLAVGVKLVYHK